MTLSRTDGAVSNREQTGHSLTCLSSLIPAGHSHGDSRARPGPSVECAFRSSKAGKRTLLTGPSNANARQASRHRHRAWSAAHSTSRAGLDLLRAAGGTQLHPMARQKILLANEPAKSCPTARDDWPRSARHDMPTVGHHGGIIGGTSRIGTHRSVLFALFLACFTVPFPFSLHINGLARKLHPSMAALVQSPPFVVAQATRCRRTASTGEMPSSSAAVSCGPNARGSLPVRSINTVSASR